jgi:hypothetical protein
MTEEPTPVTLPTLEDYTTFDTEMDEGADRGDHVPGQGQQGDSDSPPIPLGAIPGHQVPLTATHMAARTATDMEASQSSKRGRNLEGEQLAPEENEVKSSRRGASTFTAPARQQTPI